MGQVPEAQQGSLCSRACARARVVVGVAMVCALMGVLTELAKLQSSGAGEPEYEIKINGVRHVGDKIPGWDDPEEKDTGPARQGGGSAPVPREAQQEWRPPAVLQPPGVPRPASDASPSGSELFTQCAQEGSGNVCECKGKVRLGSRLLWSTWRDVSGQVECSVSVFGDPAPNQPKACVCLRLSGPAAEMLRPTPLLKAGSEPPPFAEQRSSPLVAYRTEEEANALAASYLEVVADAGAGSGPKVLCAVQTSQGRHETFVAAVRETWGARCDALVAYSDAEDSALSIVQLKRQKGATNARVDRAVITTAQGGSKDATDIVNRIVAMNGGQDLTGGERLFAVVGDPFPNQVKRLEVFRGATSLTLSESDSGGPRDNVYDLTKLFGGEERRSLELLWRDCWLHLYHNYLLDYDYFFLSRDDTYLVADNLRHLLRERRVAELYAAGLPLYLGMPMRATSGDDRTVNVAGAGVVLNRRALHMLGCEYGEGRCAQDPGSSNDALLGMCLSELDIHPLVTWDEQGRDMFHPLSPGEHLYMNMTYTATAPSDSVRQVDQLWLERSLHSTVGFECCSRRSVTFGALAPDALRSLHRGLYGAADAGGVSQPLSPKSFLGRFGGSAPAPLR